MTIEIKHGTPMHNFFLIVQPKRRYEDARIGREDKPVIILTDPHSGQTSSAELYDYWTFSDEKEFDEMNGFAYMAYGIYAKTLKEELLKRYPELRQEFVVEYWLLKRIP